MTDYQKMYFVLSHAITDAPDLAERGKLAAALELLRRAQRKAEEIYVETCERV